jgi:hypothetical protein
MNADGKKSLSFSSSCASEIQLRGLVMISTKPIEDMNATPMKAVVPSTSILKPVAIHATTRPSTLVFLVLTVARYIPHAPSLAAAAKRAACLYIGGAIFGSSLAFDFLAVAGVSAVRFYHINILEEPFDVIFFRLVNESIEILIHSAVVFSLYYGFHRGKHCIGIYGNLECKFRYHPHRPRGHYIILHTYRETMGEACSSLYRVSQNRP